MTNCKTCTCTRNFASTRTARHNPYHPRHAWTSHVAKRMCVEDRLQRHKARAAVHETNDTKIHAAAAVPSWPCCAADYTTHCYWRYCYCCCCWRSCCSCCCYYYYWTLVCPRRVHPTFCHTCTHVVASDKTRRDDPHAATSATNTHNPWYSSSFATLVACVCVMAHRAPSLKNREKFSPAAPLEKKDSTNQPPPLSLSLRPPSRLLLPLCSLTVALSKAFLFLID
jgi:hypothetical protein